MVSWSCCSFSFNLLIELTDTFIKAFLRLFNSPLMLIFWWAMYLTLSYSSFWVRDSLRFLTSLEVFYLQSQLKLCLRDWLSQTSDCVLTLLHLAHTSHRQLLDLILVSLVKLIYLVLGIFLTKTDCLSDFLKLFMIRGLFYLTSSFCFSSCWSCRHIKSFFTSPRRRLL